MPARLRITESRAERAEDLEDYWHLALADGQLTDREIAAITQRLRGNTTAWGKQVTELAFVAAYLGAGEDALNNADTRVSRLAPLAFAAD